jgi:Toxin SymE, type I toxin-antitoxin system
MKSTPHFHSINRRASKRGGRGGVREFTIVTRWCDDDSRVPMLRISGRWLQRLGFKRGDRVVVTTERNRLVITVASEETR